MTETEATELQRAGAVGEICARFFDVTGQPCATSIDRRMVAPDPDQLRSVPLVIGVATGKQKAAAILDAVRGGYVKSLVTDDVTAAEVLALAGIAAFVSRGGADTCDTDADPRGEQTRGPRSGYAPSIDRTTDDHGANGHALLAHGRRGPSN